MKRKLITILFATLVLTLLIPSVLAGATDSDEETPIEECTHWHTYVSKVCQWIGEACRIISGDVHYVILGCEA